MTPRSRQDNSQDLPETTTVCPICGRSLAPDELAWSENSDGPCCSRCLAEEESCGCADE